MSKSHFQSHYTNIAKEMQVIKIERHLKEAKARLAFCEKYNTSMVKEFQMYIIEAEKELKALKGEQ